MRWRTPSLVAAGLGLAWSTPAHACSLWFNSTFMPIPARTALGAGVQYWSDEATVMIASVDAAIRLGEKVVVRPALGMCRYEVLDESFTDTPFGLGVGFNVWNDAAGKLALNLQTGIELNSYDGGNERNIPIGAALKFKASDALSWYGGLAMMMYSDSYDIPGGGSVDDTSNDMAFFGGAMFAAGKTQITAGAGLSDGEVYFNVGAAIPLGTASAIRSFFRK